ncbi:MAG: hypothetical protein Q9182_001011 [Xanthomendoza sp. 2 TL-2023]
MSTEAPKPSTWTDTEDKLLLLQILVSQPIKINYPALSHKLNRSVSAITQHINKLKNEAKKEGLVIPGDNNSDRTQEPSSSPTKTAANIPKRPRAPRKPKMDDTGAPVAKKAKMSAAPVVEKAKVAAEEDIKAASPDAETGTEDGDVKEEEVMEIKQESQEAAGSYHE